MADYAGEEYVVEQITFGYNDEPLTDADIASVTITIFRPDKTKLVDEATMIWNPNVDWKARLGGKNVTGTGLWQYVWDTNTLPAGTYKARATVHGLSTGKNWELMQRIRLKADPLPA